MQRIEFYQLTPIKFVSGVVEFLEYYGSPIFFFSKNLVYSFNENKTNLNPCTNLHHLAFHKSNISGGDSIFSHTRTQEIEESAKSASVATHVFIYTILTALNTPGKGTGGQTPYHERED